jgi:hypothetical protein
MKRLFLTVLLLVCGLVIFAACADPGNSENWRNAVNFEYERFDGGFTVSVQSATQGTVNRTFELTTQELSNIRVHSHSSSGFLHMYIHGEDDSERFQILQGGTHADLDIDVSYLGEGSIRFTLNFNEANNTTVTVTWR